MTISSSRWSLAASTTFDPSGSKTVSLALMPDSRLPERRPARGDVRRLKFGDDKEIQNRKIVLIKP